MLDVGTPPPRAAVCLLKWLIPHGWASTSPTEPKHGKSEEDTQEPLQDHETHYKLQSLAQETDNQSSGQEVFWAS